MNQGSFQNGVKYTFYDDGSLTLICSKCFKEYVLPAGHRAVAMFHNNTTLIENNKRLTCYEKEAREKQDARTDDIYFGQSLNLANAAILVLFKDEIKQNPKLIKELLTKWQGSYYAIVKEMYKNK